LQSDAAGRNFDYYLKSTLTVFNTGNRAGALILAEGYIVNEGDSFSKQRFGRQEAQSACGTFRRETGEGGFRLSSAPPKSSNSLTLPYAGVIASRSVFSTPVVFYLFNEKESRNVTGIICLRLLISNLYSGLYEKVVPLLFVDMGVKNKEMQTPYYFFCCEDRATLIVDSVHISGIF
jgi:hypothetical protein